MITITGEMIVSGFVSKVINEIVDVPENLIKNAIKNADKNRKTQNQNIETRIYQVTIDAINEFTKGKYKGQDILYDTAESILKEFKNRKENIEAVKAGLKMLVSRVTSDTCEIFLAILCYEICKEENRDLAIEVIILQQEQTNGYIQEGFRRSFLNEEEINRKLDYLIKELSYKKGYEERSYNESPIENRAKEYEDKWDKNVFLNDFNKRDKNAGVNIKLREIYLEEHLPHYTWKADDEPLDDLKDLLSEYIVDNNDKKMLLILGQPGIGKSTLITWMMANLVEKKNDIFVYQFAADLKGVKWQNDEILSVILKTLNLSYDDLENKTLILDGFDEIYINGDRERILNKIRKELKRMNFLKRFSLIITCRQNYVEQSQLAGSDYIILQAWNEEQIKCFCEIYEKGNTRKNPEAVNRENLETKINKILDIKEIFGIPLILYMVLALNVDVEKSISMVDIYDQMFSLKKGGIYDRCYDVEHRINSPEIREHIHQVSQRIAFWIFENNSEKASIPQKEFKKICDGVIKEAGERNENLQSDVLIGNYFTTIKHCEGIGTDELQFVHRSIYEYFVTVYFFESIYKLSSKKEIAGKLGELLKAGHLSKQILEFIKYKFGSIKEHNFCSIIEEIFNIMLQDGMTYHFIKEQKEPLLDIFAREMNIFSNMLEIIHLWHRKLECLNKKIVVYLQHNRVNRLNLSEINLSEADLSRADLSGADLSGANLVEVNLGGADLCGADLSGTYLGEVDLSGANLIEANLSGAYLSGAYLGGADLGGANLSGAYLGGANLSGADLNITIFHEKQVDILHEKYNLSKSRVVLSETNETISYQEYCIRKQKAK